MNDANPIDELFKLTDFAGISELAKWLGVSRQAIDRWRKNGEVPIRRALEIKGRLAEKGVVVDISKLNKRFS